MPRSLDGRAAAVDLFLRARLDEKATAARAAGDENALRQITAWRRMLDADHPGQPDHPADEFRPNPVFMLYDYGDLVAVYADASTAEVDRQYLLAQAREDLPGRSEEIYEQRVVVEVVEPRIEPRWRQ